MKKLIKCLLAECTDIFVYNLSSVKKFFFKQKTPNKIFFLHPPKCAGSSINNYIKSQVKNSFLGISVKVNDIHARPRKTYKKARKAKYVYGHMSYQTMMSIKTKGEKNNFSFTILRCPYERLISLYNYIRSLPPEKRISAIGDKELSDLIPSMTPYEFFSTENFRLRFDLDNFYTRQFSGSLFDIPKNDYDWNCRLLESYSNLSQLDFVGLQDEFDESFATIIERLALKKPAKAPMRNVTASLNQQQELIALSTLDGATRTKLEQLIKYDLQIYTWAKKKFRATDVTKHS